MGFSLQMFFDELEEILDNDDLDEIDKLFSINNCIECSRKYATECGQLSSKGE